MADQLAFALLHGGGQGGWVWDETAGVLTAMGARVLVLDVPGCGTKRDRQTLELTLEDVADELIADIAAAGFAGATLVGHSQAGTLLPVMWRRSKGEIAKLCYVSACAPLPGQNIVEMLGEGVHGALRMRSVGRSIPKHMTGWLCGGSPSVTIWIKRKPMLSWHDWYSTNGRRS